MTPSFHHELAVYNAHLIDLLAYAGRYVTIRGKYIQGPFENPEQARRFGQVRNGAGPFLVQQIHREAPFAGPVPVLAGWWIA